ncbi:hypothetical protein C0992_001621 [Termitomyces sp. T32_za158]|nr:hypothetical protein C0992_001621 [Termitomyces sp. T32_za158]
MVDRRVLEAGPERTVTISTWREQVAHEADQQANMDVYYLDEWERKGEEEVEVLTRRRTLPPPLQREISASSSGSDPGSIGTITDEQSESAPVSKVVRAFSQGNANAELTSLQRRATSSASSRPRSAGPSSHSGRLQRRGTTSTNIRAARWQPTPPETPPRTVRGPKAESSPRSSTPKGKYTHDSESSPSFHPTRSGSTISTIKSASTLALERILESCNPSLIHAAPALARLGIRNDGHLRAIARLSDETRNRELRDAAMKEGITVMDWAMLLDRLQCDV